MEISLMALNSLINPYDKNKVLRNKIREENGLEICMELLYDTKEEVRFFASRLLRNIYYQWPVVIIEMEKIGAI